MDTPKEKKPRNTPKPIIPPQLITHREVARRMGVAPETVRDWVRRREFPEFHSRIGNLWFFEAAPFDHFIAHRAFPAGTRYRGQVDPNEVDG